MLTLKQKAREMRSAIDAIELALCGLGTDGVNSGTFLSLPARFEGCRDDMIIAPRMSVGQVREVCRAFDELNRIVNSEEYVIERSVTAPKGKEP